MKIFRINDIIDITGFARSTIYKHIEEGRFPKPISLGGRSVGWIDTEVDAWLAEKVLMRNAECNQNSDAESSASHVR